MITLSFETADPSRPSYRVGPAVSFRFVGNCLRMGPQDEQVAFHESGIWETAGGLFISIRVSGPARVCFERDDGTRGETHGPFEPLRFVDGALRCGPALSLLAVLDEKAQVWHVGPDRKDYPTAVVEAA